MNISNLDSTNESIYEKYSFRRSWLGILQSLNFFSDPKILDRMDEEIKLSGKIFSGFEIAETEQNGDVQESAQKFVTSSDLKGVEQTNNEKLNALIEKNNDTLLTKTTLIVNDVIPKSQDKNYIQIENCIKTVCSTITNDTTKLLELSNHDDNKIKTIIENIDNHLNQMITTIQQPIFSFIQSNEERTTTGLQQVKEQLSTQHINQQKLTTELNDFLNKYKNNSSTKGNISEAELYYMLQSVMPSD